MRRDVRPSVVGGSAGRDWRREASLVAWKLFPVCATGSRKLSAHPSSPGGWCPRGGRSPRGARARMDYALEDMDFTANELSIYDKLSETVEWVRQTGHQCGMSEKAIEKFIRQLLEKNEPQRGPPQYPVLITTCKVLLALILVLLATCFAIQPFTPLAPEPVLSGAHTWQALIRHIRLLSLPITKKYLPESKGAALPTTEEEGHLADLDPWWPYSGEQNTSEPIPADCIVCAHSLPLEVTLLEAAPRMFNHLRQLVIKTGQPLRKEEVQRFLCRYPEAAEGFPEGVLTKWRRCFAERWFPFPYPWRRPQNRSQILHELFPVFTHLSFPKAASLNKCFLLHPEPVVGSKMHKVHDLFAVGSGEAMLQLIPPFRCRRHCQSVAMPVEAGDIGYASATHWKAYIIARGTQPLVFCDGTTLSEI